MLIPLCLEVEVRSSVTHIVTPRVVKDWLNGGAKTRREAVMKERLRALLQFRRQEGACSRIGRLSLRGSSMYPKLGGRHVER